MQQQRLVTILGCLSVLIGGSSTVLGFVWGPRGLSPLTRSGQTSPPASPPSRLFAQALTRPAESTDQGTRVLAELKSAAQAGDSAKALDLLKSLDDAAVPKTVVHFNRALKACVQGKALDQLPGVLEQMNASGTAWDETTVKLLVSTYAEQGKLAEALDVFEQAREDELIGTVDRALYDVVIGAYRRTDALEKAMDLCDEMRSLRLAPTKEGYAFIATVAVRDGKTYLIARTLETMRAEGFEEGEVAYVQKVIEEELPEGLKHQVGGKVVAPA